MCGEHGSEKVIVDDNEGSSPRVRGTPLDWNNHIDITRDHPRVCGEHFPLVDTVIFDEGSSPRVRGTPLRTAAATT